MPKTQRLAEAYKELESSYEAVINAVDATAVITALKALKADADWIRNIILAQRREDAGIKDPPKKKRRKRLPSSAKHKKALPKPKPKTLPRPKTKLLKG